MKSTAKNNAVQFNSFIANENLITFILENIEKTEAEAALYINKKTQIKIDNNNNLIFQTNLERKENDRNIESVPFMQKYKLNSKLIFKFLLYGIKQKLNDIKAIPQSKEIVKTETDPNTGEKMQTKEKIFFNYTTEEFKAKTLAQFAKAAELFERGEWELKAPKADLVAVALNLEKIKNIIKLREFKIDLKTALAMNADNTDLVEKIYDLDDKELLEFKKNNNI